MMRGKTAAKTGIGRNYRQPDRPTLAGGLHAGGTGDTAATAEGLIRIG
jgi:hypothetical protein